MRRVIAVMIAVVVSCDSAQAGPTLEHRLAMEGEDAVFTETNWDVVLARVVRAGGGRTNANPPRLDLDVLEVLRGGKLVDRSRALWQSFPHDIDWVDGNSDSLIARWERQPLAAPAIGDSLILAGVMTADSTGLLFEISPVGRFEFDARRHRWVKEAIESGARLGAEATEYAHAWNRAFKIEELADGARPVLPGTTLSVGEPVLLRRNLFLRGRVVRTNADGTVVVRLEGSDSRWDESVGRDALLLYPERLLDEQRLK